MREKRLDADIWMLHGDNCKGSHFPLCVVTNNVGRRSPEKLDRREKRREEFRLAVDSLAVAMAHQLERRLALGRTRTSQRQQRQQLPTSTRSELMWALIS